jgi:glycosyltransferase involved in cell wall biosynthesis
LSPLRNAMRILALTRYDELGASSRLRTHQFKPHLEAQGICVRTEPFFDDAYVRALYATGRRAGSIPGCFMRRAGALLRCTDADVIWLEKEAFPWLPWFIESVCLPRSIPLVVDYDDAVFHRYDGHPSAVVRALLGAKIDAVMRRADLVLAGNDYLARRARSAGARNVEVVPTVVDLDRYHATGPKAAAGPIVIGWIGSPTTAPYLEPLQHLLGRMTGRAPVSCVAIGAREDQVAGGPFEAKPWSLADEVASLRGLDIGIMPLPDEPWTRGKCGYKLIQYMACGLAVVASPVGVNTEIVRHGENGFLASTDREWEEALIRLVADPDLRRRMGSAGRERVEAEFSLQSQAPRLGHLLRSVSAKAAHAARPVCDERQIPC